MVVLDAAHHHHTEDTMADDNDPTRRRALARYQVISAYLALDPPRGQRHKLLEQLAAKTWTTEDSEPLVVAAETIRAWVRRYRQGGLPALADKAHPRRGVQSMTPEQVELACQLKRQVPARSLDRILVIMTTTGKVQPGKVSRICCCRPSASRSVRVTGDNQRLSESCCGAVKRKTGRPSSSWT